MPFYEKSDIRIRYEVASGGFRPEDFAFRKLLGP
jgi:hypothetical protein